MPDQTTKRKIDLYKTLAQHSKAEAIKVRNPDFRQKKVRILIKRHRQIKFV